MHRFVRNLLRSIIDKAASGVLPHQFLLLLFLELCKGLFFSLAVSLAAQPEVDCGQRHVACKLKSGCGFGIRLFDECGCFRELFFGLVAQTEL